MEPSANSPRPLKLPYVVALLLAVGLAAFGGYEYHRAHETGLLGLGVLGIVTVLVTWPLAARFGTIRVGEALTPVYERLEQFSIILHEMSEQQLLSEQAKTVAYREKDREALRRAIREDLAKKDWEAALALVEEMDNRFGYKQEAEQVRAEINQQFAEHIRRQVHQTRAVIERYTAQQQWAAAQREADRMAEQFPTNGDAAALTTEIEAARQRYKNKLLTDYNDMIAKKDVDGAIATVKQLDFYLTPEEGAGMSDSVRGVFRDKQTQLREALTEFIHRGDWARAHATGEEIVRDFPNTQMAREVKDKLESLKQRAQEAAGTPAV